MSAHLSESQRKRSTNLSLAPHRLSFGQQYAEANQTSLSRVVEELLGALEQAVTLRMDSATRDPLDGLLAGWPTSSKQELRRAQHEARLAKALFLAERQEKVDLFIAANTVATLHG